MLLPFQTTKHADLLPSPSLERSSSSPNEKQKIPRPMNSFMCFARIWRPKLQTEHPTETNNQISHRLGQMWKHFNPAEKKIYEDEAGRLAEEHKKLFPDYVYCPMVARQRKRQNQLNGIKTKSTRNRSNTNTAANRIDPSLFMLAAAATSAGGAVGAAENHTASPTTATYTTIFPPSSAVGSTDPALELCQDDRDALRDMVAMSHFSSQMMPPPPQPSYDTGCYMQNQVTSTASSLGGPVPDLMYTDPFCAAMPDTAQLLHDVISGSGVPGVSWPYDNHFCGFEQQPDYLEEQTMRMFGKCPDAPVMRQERQQPPPATTAAKTTETALAANDVIMVPMSRDEAIARGYVQAIGVGSYNECDPKLTAAAHNSAAMAGMPQSQWWNTKPVPSWQEFCTNPESEALHVPDLEPCVFYDYKKVENVTEPQLTTLDPVKPIPQVGNTGDTQTTQHIANDHQWAEHTLHFPESHFSWPNIADIPAEWCAKDRKNNIQHTAHNDGQCHEDVNISTRGDQHPAFISIQDMPLNDYSIACRDITNFSNSQLDTLMAQKDVAGETSVHPTNSNDTPPKKKQKT